MVAHMNRLTCITMLLMALHALPVSAESLADPTRPPNVTDAIGADGLPLAETGPVLQGVSLSKKRKTATINGQQLGVGDYFGEAKLVRVGDAEAELQYPDGRKETLRMFPQVEKHPTVKGSVKKTQQKMPANP